MWNCDGWIKFCEWRVIVWTGTDVMEWLEWAMMDRLGLVLYTCMQ